MQSLGTSTVPTILKMRKLKVNDPSALIIDLKLTFENVVGVIIVEVSNQDVTKQKGDGFSASSRFHLH